MNQDRSNNGDKPVTAIFWIFFAILAFSAFYLLYGKAGLVILAFAFWVPLIPFRWVGFKFVAPYLQQHPDRIPTPATTLLGYVGVFSTTIALSILGRQLLVSWQIGLPWLSTWLGILLLGVTFLIWYTMARKIGWKYRTVAMPELESRLNSPVTDGIYAYTRHPEYLSEPICIIGLFLITGATSLLLLLGLWALFIYPVISLEERYLIGRYGFEYQRYAQRTSKLLLRR
ncbi:MAG: isoprenylcysteine carboxylmethyltransferase family protein [Chloroflexi bacterium]|nr:isoprenylcysteine carboxylmethyltransferase family protein [Chloroflexota bacterium]